NVEERRLSDLPDVHKPQHERDCKNEDGSQRRYPNATAERAETAESSRSLRARRVLRLLFMVTLLFVAALTFHQDIAPIVRARCATCHRPGEIGPFSLLTYSDVKQRLTQIKIVTERRIMPPWKPEPGKGEFEGERRLTDRELATIQEWISTGA